MPVDVVRAWKDLEYRRSLSAEEEATIPLNPAGYALLTEEEWKNFGPEPHIGSCRGPCGTPPMSCDLPRAVKDQVQRSRTTTK
jgi:mersacidin/lichenicidin family type 2 lantibiotic